MRRGTFNRQTGQTTRGSRRKTHWAGSPPGPMAKRFRLPKNKADQSN